MDSWGHTILKAQFFLSVFSVLFAVACLRQPIGPVAVRIFNLARILLISAAVCCLTALCLLFAAFLRDDFSIKLVADYSSADLPIPYKISALWASSTGSFLLWLFFMMACTVIWSFRMNKMGIRFAASAFSIAATICVSFITIVILIADPFVPSAPATNEGLGLNPLLQNFWMVSHPPVLFAGYSLFLIPFAMISALLLTAPANEKYILNSIRRWLLCAFCVLVLGITAGARWAYLVLGWGGFWGWDPVENASLLPALASIAAFHSLVITRKTGQSKLFTAVLICCPFILCLLAAFLTRSGIVQSVHTFDGTSMGTALLIVAAVSLLWIFGCLLAARKTESAKKPYLTETAFNPTHLISIANLVFIFIAIVILTATFWPIVSRILTGRAITPPREFYDNSAALWGILIVFLLGLLASQGWFRFALCLFLGLGIFWLLFVTRKMPLIPSAFFTVCVFTSAAMLMWFPRGVKTLRQFLAATAHIAVLILFISIAAASIGEKSIFVSLEKGEQAEFGGYEFLYTGFRHQQGDSILKAGPEITVSKGEKQFLLWPHTDIYQNGQTFSTVAVHSGPFEDIYLIFDSPNHKGGVNIQMILKPMMTWLWGSVILLVACSAAACLTAKET